MSQLPHTRSNPRRLRTIDGRAFRRFLAIGLSALLFLAPLSFSASAQQPYESKVLGGIAGGIKLKKDNLDGFIIEMIDGQTVCRAARAEERPYLMAPRNASRESIRVGPRKSQDAPQGSIKTEGGDNITIGSGGLTIILNSLSQLQSDPNRAQVEDAFVRAAHFWTDRIKSPVTVRIDIDYGFNRPGGGAFPSGVLGSTGSASVSIEYPNMRASLVGSASSPAESALYNSLPTSALPVDTGNGNFASVNTSVAKALGISASTGIDASISFNKNFPFDFNHGSTINPSQTDFVAVATHEIGHALGFTSNSGEGSTSVPTTWDFFRFRPGAASGAFTTTQRIMALGGDQVFYTGQTYTVAGSPTTELGVSTGGNNPDPSIPQNAPDGSGSQSSHWKGDEVTGKFVGIMDPTISRGVKEEPTENDYATLELIGWDLVGGVTIPTPSRPANDNFASAQTISGCSGSVTGTSLNATSEPGEPSHDPPDTFSGSPGSTVWYQWQAPSSGKVTITTEGSTFDTIAAVYTGSSLGSLTQLKFNDDVDPGIITTSSLNFDATAGTTYKIVIDGWGGDSGAFKLNWSESGCTQATTVQFSPVSYSASEAAGTINLAVTRTDSTSAASVDYATSDTSGLTNCNQATGNASSRCDYATTVGTLRFAAGESSKNISIPVVDDGYVEGAEIFRVNLSNPVGATLGNSTATVTINDNDTTAFNPIVGVPFFVRQQYIDFLGREPDPGGFAAWQGILNGCPSSGKDSNGNFCDRIEVSSGFFRSPEFNQRGGFVFLFYPVAFGRNPSYAEFMPDLAKVSGFLDAQQLEANKAAFVQEFMTRAEFNNRYGSLTDSAFVDALMQTAGVTNTQLSTNLKQSLAQGASRATVLRNLVEGADVATKYTNQMFVVMQYFGYLRRDPDALYTQWIQTMNTNGGDYRVMINGFINAPEYFLRFGP